MQNVRTSNWFLYFALPATKEIFSTNPDKSNLKKERKEAVDCNWLALPNRQKSLLLQEVSNAHVRLLALNPTD